MISSQWLSFSFPNPEIIQIESGLVWCDESEAVRVNNAHFPCTHEESMSRLDTLQVLWGNLPAYIVIPLAVYPEALIITLTQAS